MSSRALRKLRGDGDILTDGLPAGEDSEEEVPYPVVSKSKKKKKKGVNIPDNPFDLVSFYKKKRHLPKTLKCLNIVYTRWV